MPVALESVLNRVMITSLSLTLLGREWVGHCGICALEDIFGTYICCTAALIIELAESLETEDLGSSIFSLLINLPVVVPSSFPTLVLPC